MDDSKEPTILVFGDPVKDEYLLPQLRRGGIGGDEDLCDWQHHDQWVRLEDDGGVYMTARMLEGYEEAQVFVAAPAEIEQSDEANKPDLVSMVEIAPCKMDSESSKPRFFLTEQVRHQIRTGEQANSALYRVTKFHGYSGTVGAKVSYRLPEGAPDKPNAIVLNDAGNVLRHSDEGSHNAFVKAMQDVSGTDVIMKMHLPLMKGLAWELLASADQARRRVVIVHANDLREAGIPLSRCPSWDQMMCDLILARSRNNGKLKELVAGCDTLVILFDVEGAAIIEQRSSNHFSLVFEPGAAEGSVAASVPGYMVGTMNSFLARFVLDLAKRKDGTTTTELVAQALAGARYFNESGYTRDGEKIIYPDMVKWVASRDAAETSGAKGLPMYQTIAVPWSAFHDGSQAVDLLRLVTQADPNLSGLSLAERYLEKAREIVLKGVDGEIKGVPHGRFGKLVTVDRGEIECLRAVNTLIKGYLAEPSLSKPLSIAVFGPPGSGKSFGVKQLVDEDETPIREYNLSQADESQLPGFFHEIRDLNLEGTPPLCFFDEFDSQDLRLLKSFLAPMQDGVFLEDQALRPIGRGIFVFAGGTASSMESFVQHSRLTDENAAEYRDAVTKKVPDFVSRLQGFLDVKGPNAVSSVQGADFAKRSADDPSFVLRRAILLRHFFNRYLPGVIDHDSKEASVDGKLLNALLEVEDYKHGARSMELLIQAMAGTSSPRKLDRSHLPIDRLVEHYVSPLRSLTDRLL